MFVSVVQVFVTRMSKAMVPEELFSSSTDGIDRNGFINHEIEATKVDSLEGLRCAVKAVVDFVVLASFEEVDFGANSVSANINKRCIAFTSKIKTVLSSSKQVCLLHIWKDEWMCVELASK